MPDPTPASMKPPRPLWRWVLIGSLCLNLALIGVLGGMFLMGPPGPPPPPGLWGYGRALPEPYRHDLAQALRDSRREWSGPRETLWRQREALAEALTADPYDPLVVAEVITREPRLLDTLAQRGSQLLLDQIDRMTPIDRAAFAEALRKARGPGSGRPPPPPPGERPDPGGAPGQD